MDLLTGFSTTSFNRYTKPCPFDYEKSKGKKFLKRGVSHPLTKKSGRIMQSIEGSSPGSVRAEITFNILIFKTVNE